MYMSATGFAYNPKYTPASPLVPRSVRRRWARKGSHTRLKHLLENCRMQLDEISMAMGEHVTPAQAKWERLRASNPELLVVNNPGRRKMRKKRQRRGWARRGSYESFVIKYGVREGARRYRQQRKKRTPAKRVRNSSRKRARTRARNGRLAVKYRKRYYTRSQLMKKMGAKKGASCFRKKPKWHKEKGRYRRVACPTKKRRRRANRSRRSSARRSRRRTFRRRKRN